MDFLDFISDIKVDGISFFIAFIAAVISSHSFTNRHEYPDNETSSFYLKRFFNGVVIFTIAFFCSGVLISAMLKSI